MPYFWDYFCERAVEMRVKWQFFNFQENLFYKINVVGKAVAQRNTIYIKLFISWLITEKDLTYDMNILEK